MDKPQTTRLRYISAKDPADIVSWLDQLGVRVQVYGSPVWDGRKWFLWFVPADAGKDIEPQNL